MLADAVGDFFSALLDAVTAVFEAARAAVNGIIDQFKEWANAAIDFVRDLAISAINALADVLIAIGDVLLAAFPELRDKFRKAIEGMRDAAISAVNQLADGLKKAVNALLDALAAGLNALLTALEAGIKLVIKAYQAVIEGAIKFAQAAIEALGKFAALIADIAPDPGGWLAKAGSSAKSGITDHLWGAIKVAVKRWFDTKVEGILGLGKAVIDVLVKGCVSLKQIGKMAWDAIVASLPMMIASLVIEKVVSMLVPAAGAILTIVQGLMAAWQSISSILTAFSKFWAYLKAVKAGPAACLFAEAVAAGVVALLDFIANFLMIRLASATKGVGKRLQDMSQKIMNGLKRTGKGGKQAAGDAVNNARGAMRNANQKVAAPGAAAPKPKGAPSPAPKAPVKPKDAATPKGPAKNPTPAKPKDTGPAKSEAPGKDRTPDRERTPDKDRTPEPSKDKTPDSKDKTPARDKTPDAPSPKKKKEIEGPKPKKPKKPKSPAKKALSKAKGAVKSALKKVGNAAKTLGNKLKKSKLGKSLKNGAKKLRDLFKKKKDRLRDDKKRQQDQKKQQQDQRRKDEKSRESKDARLAKIVARIRPMIARLLRQGVPGVALRAALAGMRLWYRLTDLVAAGSPEFDIDAVLNPRKAAGGGFILTGYDLRRLAEQVAEDIMKRPDVEEAAIRMRRSKAAVGPDDEDHQLEISSPQDLPGAVQYYQGRSEELDLSRPGGTPKTLGPHTPREGTKRPRVEGATEEHVIGRDRHVVAEENMVGATNAETQGGLGTYQQINKALRDTGLHDSVIAQALRKYTRSRKFPTLFTAEQRTLLAHLHWLMTVRESARRTANLAMAPMTIELVRRGQMTWQQAFTEFRGRDDRRGGGGFFPMSMKGAAEAARGLFERRRARGQSEAALDRRELRKREKELTERWARAVNDGNDIWGSSKAEAIKNGRSKIEEFMLKFYGL